MYPVNDYLIIEEIHEANPPESTSAVLYTPPKDYQVRRYKVKESAFGVDYGGKEIFAPLSAVLELPDGTLAIKHQEVIAHA